VNQSIFSHTEQIPACYPADLLLLDMPALSKRLGMCRSKIYLEIQAGKFPQPLKLGRSSRWLAAEIQAWVNAQAEARSPKTEG